MLNIFLYLTTALIWGSTWLAIQYQLGQVSPLWSVAYRFAIATVIMLGYCVFAGHNLRFTAKQHRAMALQGLFLFSLNYVLYYYGSQYFISGLVSILFASIIVMNIINSRIFFKTPLVPRVIIGAALGLIGLSVTFSSQFKAIQSYPGGLNKLLIGLGICLTATFLASLGNMVSLYNQRLKLPIVQSNTIGMFYGTLIVTAIALIAGEKPTFDPSIKYAGSLFYLAFVGTILAFGAYLNLLGRIGPGRAAYTFVLIPVVSLTLSTHFEGFQWTLTAMVGVILVIWGNVLVLTNKKTPQTSSANLENSAATARE